MSYKINYVDRLERFDEQIQGEGECPLRPRPARVDSARLSPGFKIGIDGKSLLLLIGTEIDYIDDDIREEFIFKNPRAKNTCGCGESFHF